MLRSAYRMASVTDLLDAALGGRGLVLRRLDRVLGGGNEAVEGLLGLLHALFGECPHLRRDFEIRSAILGHETSCLHPALPDDLTIIGAACHSRQSVRPPINVICGLLPATRADAWTLRRRRPY